MSIHFFKYIPFVCCFVHSHILHPFKINYLTLLDCFKCTCITKHMLNSARNEIPLTQFINSCYYYSGRKAAKYSTDPHMSGHRHGVAPYKEDPCGRLGQWGTVGVEWTWPWAARVTPSTQDQHYSPWMEFSGDQTFIWRQG